MRKTKLVTMAEQYMKGVRGALQAVLQHVVPAVPGDRPPPRSRSGTSRSGASRRTARAADPEVCKTLRCVSFIYIYIYICVKCICHKHYKREILYLSY